MDDETKERLDNLENRLEDKHRKFELQLKERETNLFRALKAFSEDIYVFQKDPQKGFPFASLQGLAFAILKRRMLLIIGSLIAVSFTGIQVYLLYNQNKLLNIQNTKIDIQNSLMEAERRGSLIMLMSNIVDQMSEEINDQKRDTLNKNPNADLSSVLYELSPPLIGRIAALSQGFRPYKTIQNDSLVGVVAWLPSA